MIITIANQDFDVPGSPSVEAVVRYVLKHATDNQIAFIKANFNTITVNGHPLNNKIKDTIKGLGQYLLVDLARETYLAN